MSERQAVFRGNRERRGVFDTLLAPKYLAAALVGHTRLVDSRYAPDCCVACRLMRMQTSRLALLIIYVVVNDTSSAQLHCCSWQKPPCASHVGMASVVADATHWPCTGERRTWAERSSGRRRCDAVRCSDVRSWRHARPSSVCRRLRGACWCGAEWPPCAPRRWSSRPASEAAAPAEPLGDSR